MLRHRDAVRFTTNEVAEFRALGIDVDGVRTQADAACAITQWVETLQDERPALLEKIVTEMARAKGVPLPTIFRLVKIS